MNYNSIPVDQKLREVPFDEAGEKKTNFRIKDIESLNCTNE
jgi:hypothetical protein